MSIAMEKELKIFTKEEVSVHNKEQDCWIILGTNVYDVSKFLDGHPGGQDILLMYAGQDCVNEFNDIGHSKDARELVEKYKIGVLTK